MPDDQTLDETDPIDPAAHAALQQTNASLAIDNAMLRAGIDLDTPVGKMFRKAWDGEADVEKIKTAAADIPGAIRTVEAPAPAAAAEEPEREEGEAGQLAARTALTTGDAAGLEDPNPQTTAFDRARQTLDNGGRRADAMSGAIGDLVDAAMAGDTRVLVE